MSFQINTNVPAISAHRSAARTTMSLEKSMNRLSTGLRIATAADDPSGLVAADLFKAQSSSLETATRNNQEAINYAKTAEGALAEINGLLTDARALAIQSGNNATLSPVQLQANQDQINSIIASINRISKHTQYGTRRILDGSAGITAQVSNGARVAGLNFVGSVNGASMTTNGLVTVNAVSAAATRGTVNSAVMGTGVVFNAGSFSINGVTFNVAAGTTTTAVTAMINAASDQTGVTANTTAGVITMTTKEFGSRHSITFSDPGGVISAVGSNSFSVGTDARATVTLPGGVTTLFTGGRNGMDGLSLLDADGNLLRLTEAGNVTTGWPMTVGQISVGNASFQIGANANQTTSLTLPDTGATQLGNDLVLGLNLSRIDVTSSAGATQALQIIDRAVEQVASIRGRIGQFQRYALESNNRSLQVARENMIASESSIRDADMAAEMTQFTKFQVMQQAGLAMLGQANNLPQGVLSLLRG